MIQIITKLDVLDIINIFEGAAKNLELNRALVDSLNVFPVPDGDTGTNMNLTMASTVKEMCLATDKGSICEVCGAFSKGALKGARGNSGVILSQIFKGMASVLKDAQTLNTKEFAKSLKSGANAAYDVVMNPKEGTMLTVARVMGDYAVKIASKKTNFLDFFKAVIKRGEEVLDDTPNMLPVLKKAGVVDAGGKGFLVIITGMYNVLAGIPIELPEGQEGATAPKSDVFLPDIHSLEEIEFAYCTEFFVINLNKTTTLSDIDKLRDKLGKIGDSVVVVGDLSLVKVHVHTNTPDKALGFALQLGELDKLKIENMLEQSREFVAAIENQKKKPMGMVAICVGEGLKEIFTELNADAILEGGQTMNPSVSDIVDIVNSVNADNVFILPNNKNIIMAAEQAKELVKSNLVIIATKNIPQGIAAAINFNTEASIEANVREMQKAAEGVKSGSVTRAVRDTEMDGFELHDGDIIGLKNGGTIIAQGADMADVAAKVVKELACKGTAAINLYYGEGVTDKDANALLTSMRKKYPRHDVEVYYGGQTHYYYFISVE